MNRHEFKQTIVLFAVAIAAHALVFKHVGIWGDYGFYQYDARLILQGQTPFIDFLGRSPVFNYLYAAAVALIGHPTELVRAFMHLWWVLTGVPVYAITRHVRDHRSGLAAVAFLLLIPFALVYGSWANTQAVAAFFGTTAVLVLIKSRRIPAYGLAGVLLGVAYLSRRSVIVLLFAVLLYTAYRYARYESSSIQGAIKSSSARCGSITAGFLLVVFAIYAAMAGFDPGTTWALFEVHSVNLFISYGRGGYPLLGVDAPIVTNELASGRIPIFNDLCQMCGAWTARTFAKTITVAVPAIGLLWYYLRDLESHYFDQRAIPYLYGILAVLGVYAIVVAGLAGYPVRVGVVVSLAGFAYLAHRTDAVEREILYNRDLQLVLVVLAGLTAGYLYRRRVLHTYYFMDFWPYLSVLSGLIGVRVWELADRHSRFLLAAVLVIGTVAAFLGAHPLTVIALQNNDAGWFTMDNMHDYQDDLNQRTDPDDIVFASNPSYVALSHAKMPMDRPRLHMVAARYKNSGPSADQYRVLNEGMRNGRIEHVIVSRTTVQMFRWNETAQTTFQENYCRVADADQLYQRTDAYLFEWVGDSSDCPSQLTPSMPRLKNATGETA